MSRFASQRISQVPPYLFAELDKKEAALRAAGRDVISLGIGDPDRPTPDFIRNRMHAAVDDPSNHRYPAYAGSTAFRQAVADYYQRRYGVTLDPQREVMALIGSKEGIGHLAWALIDPGDVVLVPDPGYPVYRIATLFAGGQPYDLSLLPRNGFLPDLDVLSDEVLKRAKLLYLNYPNNPTAAVCDLAFYERVVDLAHRYNIAVASDLAYGEITFDGYEAPSILQAPGAKEVAVEFGSLSKPFNMTGWRIGYVVGNAEIIAALGIIKTNLDSGQFTAVQQAAITALQTPDEAIAQARALYAQRQKTMLEALRQLGLEVSPPKGSFYLWLPTPPGYTSAAFADAVLQQTAVVVSPGSAFGPSGEGFFRISLTVDTSRLQEAARRLAQDLQVRWR